MNSAERREAILRLLRKAHQPVTGSQLSQIFGVTRQVVADIAILRAQGEHIMATPKATSSTQADRGLGSGGPSQPAIQVIWTRSVLNWRWWWSWAVRLSM